MKAIIFDIETIAQNEELLLARAPDFKLDSRLKDPEKIAESFAKKRNEYLEYAALDWKTAQVVLIGAGDSTQIQSMTGEKVDGETAGEEKRLRVLETFECKDGKVAKTKQLMEKIEATGNVLLVVSLKDALVERATNNLPNVKAVHANYLNVYDIMNADTIVMSNEALELVHEWLGEKK